MGVTWSLGRRSKIRQRKYNYTKRTPRKIRLPRRRLGPRKNRKLKRNQSPKKNLRRQKRNERESFDQSCRQGSEDRHHRRRSWNASCPRCRCCHPCGATLRQRKYKNEGGSGYVRRETVAAKRNGARPRRLRFIADLARW